MSKQNKTATKTAKVEKLGGKFYEFRGYEIENLMEYKQENGKVYYRQGKKKKGCTASMDKWYPCGKKIKTVEQAVNKKINEGYVKIA